MGNTLHPPYAGPDKKGFLILTVETQEAQRIVMRGPSNILTYDLPRSFLSSDRISY